MAYHELPDKIQAIGIQHFGDFEVIEELTVPFPPPETDHVVVKVEFGGVNFIDTYERAGVYPAAKFPKILGQEVGGIVIKLPTAEKVLNDPEYQARKLSVGSRVGVLAPGSFSEYVAVPWAKVAPLPDNVTTRDAATLLLQGLTALTFATESYEVKGGETVLVYSAAGGVGIILTQIAVKRGATVIATVSSEAKAEFVRKLGAQHVIISTESNVADDVLKLTGGEGVHAVFDGTGKDTFDDNFKLIRRKGTIVSLGNASGVVPPFPILKLGEKNVKLLRPRLFAYIHTPAESLHYTNELFRLVAEGSIKPEVHLEYPFSAEGVQQSQKDITSRGTIGKLLIKF